MVDIDRLTPEEQRELLVLLEEQDRREKRRKLFTLYPDEGPLRRELYPKHLEFFRAGREYRERCAMAANRIGKALRHGTRVATPSGWRAIETLRPGDSVIAGDGSVVRVLGVYPQGVKALHRLTFDAGQTIDCCAEHLWRYQHPRARYPYRQSHGSRQVNPFFGEWSVADTAEILRQVGPAPTTRMRVATPAPPVWQLPARPVPLDPYLLGLLLGDGGLTGETPTFTSADEELLAAVRALVPEGVELGSTGNRYTFRLSVPGAPKGGNPLTSHLRGLGIFGHGAHTKRVPPDYLLGSADQRLAVLQGLLDTDGGLTPAGSIDFSSCSEQLAADVAQLVVSLGGRATTESRQTHCTHRGEKRAGAPSWRVRIRMAQSPFRLARKAERFARLRHERTYDRVLHRIEDAAPGHATCIEVDHPDHTFVIEHGIVTHNSFGMGGYETALHLTGLYPDWWQGRRFNHAVEFWAAGKTNETTRDIVQAILLGEIERMGPVRTMSGTGLIPGENLGAVTWKQGVPDLVDSVKVKHTSGDWSVLGLKSYQQGRGSFEGTAKHGIWLDEEPPADIYGECVIRTATTNGLVFLTFTPLEGMSETVLSFLPGGKIPDPNDKQSFGRTV